MEILLAPLLIPIMMIVAIVMMLFGLSMFLMFLPVIILFTIASVFFSISPIVLIAVAVIYFIFKKALKMKFILYFLTAIAFLAMPTWLKVCVVLAVAYHFYQDRKA